MRTTTANTLITIICSENSGSQDQYRTTHFGNGDVNNGSTVNNQILDSPPTPPVESSQSNSNQEEREEGSYEAEGLTEVSTDRESGTDENSCLFVKKKGLIVLLVCALSLILTVIGIPSTRSQPHTLTIETLTQENLNENINILNLIPITTESTNHTMSSSGKIIFRATRNQPKIPKVHPNKTVYLTLIPNDEIDWFKWKPGEKETENVSKLILEWGLIMVSLGHILHFCKYLPIPSIIIQADQTYEITCPPRS